MPTILIDTTPLSGGHAIRGVGTYTRLLIEALQKLPDLEVYLSGQNELKGKPDLVHYPFFDLFFPTLPLIRTSKTVVTIHDVIPLLFPQYYPVGKKGRLAFYRQKILLNTVEAILTDSATSKQDIIKELGIAEHKITVVPLAANPALQAADENQIKKVKKTFSLPKEYVLYVGDINYNKNIPQLIKAMKGLPAQMHLVLVGKNFIPQEIPEWRWIEAQIALSDVAERVHMITNIASDDTDTMSAIYSGAVCYVQPSLYEGFGLPVLEAMQCNTPVIASNRSCLPEVGGGVIELAEPMAEAFAETITHVRAWSETKREQVLRKQRQWVKHFSWEQTAEQTAAVYKRILR